MKKIFVFLLALTLTFPVLAAETKVTAQVAHTDFSNGFGERSVVELDAVTRMENATVILTAAHGERKVDEGPSFDGQRLAGQFYMNWSPRLTTRTLVGLGSDSPVFAKRDFGQDFNIRLNSPTVVLLGARYTDYFEDVNVKAYTVGLTHYFTGRFNASYRFTRYDSERTGWNNGNLVMLRLRDAEGGGVTQLWLGHAAPLYAYEWLPDVTEGQQQSVVLRRVQPLGDAASLNILLGKTWYETPAADYDGLQVGLGLTWNW